MRIIPALFLFLALAFPSRADVEIEYAIFTNKQFPQALLPLFPQRIQIRINTQGDIVVRGNNPSEYMNSYDLYPNGHLYWYQCQDNLAYQRPYSR